MAQEYGITIDEIRQITISDAVSLLQLAGCDVNTEEIEANISAGAPINPDGTLDLVEYASWLIENVKNSPKN